MRARLAYAYLAAGTVLTALVLLVPGAYPLWSVLGLSAVAATVVGVRRNRPSAPLAWWLIAAGELTFVSGDTIYTVLLRIGHGHAPFPSVGDLAYLVTYPLLAAGLLLLVRARTVGRDRTSLLDALAIATGMGMLSWLFLIVPYVRGPELTLLQRFTAIGYPVGDLLLIAVVARLWVAGGTRQPSYYLLMTGAIGTLLADALFGLLQLQGVWQRGGPVDLGWAAFYLTWGAAALHPSMRTLSAPAPAGPAHLTYRRLALLAGVSLIAPAVLLLQWLRREPIDVPVIAGGSVVLFLIALARMRDLATQVAAQVERRRVLDRIIHATEDERSRMAGDLHDGPVQHLTALRYMASRVLLRLERGDQDGARQLLDQLGGDLADVTASLRQTMAALRPAALDEHGLEGALRQHLASVQRDGEISYQLEATLPESLPGPVETVLFRVAQEALTNVAKHARAHNVAVLLATDNGHVNLTIEDDGIGFDPGGSSQLARDGHFGLVGMQERVATAGGELTLNSVSGSGTRIKVSLPRIPPNAIPPAP
jgi:signal transduction histidine kinase